MDDTTTDTRAGSQFGPYLLRRLVGRGGMGDVYEAEDTVRERVVALKLMSPTLSNDPVFRSRMQREARTAGRLHEPHVVPIHDFGEIDGQLYVDMRLIDGKDLAGMLKRYGPLSPPRAVAIVRQIGSALDAAHAAGILHRDVKPENILVSADDFAYLVDFGIASATSDEKLTQIGTTVGTAKYMAPERFGDSQVTHRADIYALACVLYECLTGSPPYTGDQLSVIGAHVHQPIPRPSAARPSIPTGFDEVIARGMAKNPDDRYLTCGDLSSAAYAALAAPDQDGPPTSWRVPRWQRRLRHSPPRYPGASRRRRPRRRRGPPLRAPASHLLPAGRYPNRPAGAQLGAGATPVARRRGRHRRKRAAGPGCGSASPPPSPWRSSGRCSPWSARGNLSPRRSRLRRRHHRTPWRCGCSMTVCTWAVRPHGRRSTSSTNPSARRAAPSSDRTAPTSTRR